MLYQNDTATATEYEPLPFYLKSSPPKSVSAFAWREAGRSLDPQDLASLGLQLADAGFASFIVPADSENVDSEEIRARNDHAFRYACARGQEDVARRLYSLGDIDIHADDDCAIRWACEKNHGDIARWLHYDLGANVHAGNEYAFRNACKNGHEALARWLYGLGGVNIREYDDYAYHFACLNGHASIASWLRDLGSVGRAETNYKL
jgi:hypothetical protein